MSWDFFRDKTGKTFIVNWTGVRAIVRSYLHSKLMWEHSGILVETNWIGPDVYNLHVDFVKVRSLKECLTEEVLRDFYDAATISMSEGTRMLEQMLAETIHYDTQFTQQNKLASDYTMRNINNSVEKGEIALETATVIRDTAAEILLVGAAFAKGGAAYAALGGGALLKGAAKYQDTGNAGAGLAEAAFTFGFGVVGMKVIPVKASTAEKVTLNIFVSFGQNFIGEPAKAWAGGEDVSNALVSGSLKAGIAPMHELLKEQLSPEALKKVFNSNKKLKAIALPLQVGMNVLADKSVAGIVDKSKPNQPPKKVPKQDKEELLDTTRLNKKFIENAAVKIYN